VVKYDNDEFPGKVTSIYDDDDDDDIEADVMARSSRTWKWLTPESKFYKKDIPCIISVAGNLGQFAFTNI